MGEAAFSGAKIAVLVRGTVLTLLRDDRADIPWPAMWDLPGGGREGAETPRDCALRELREELGLRLDPGRIVWQRAHAAVLSGQGPTWFLAAEPPFVDGAAIRLGDEGQAWRWMPVAEFPAHPRAIPHLRARLRAYLDRRGR